MKRFVIVLGCSAVGKHFFVARAIQKDTCVSGGIQKCIYWENNNEIERLPVGIGQCDVLYLIYQFRYGFAGLARAVHTVIDRDTPVQLVFLYCDPLIHICRFHEKHGRNQVLIDSGDYISSLLIHGDTERAAKILKSATEGLFTEMNGFASILISDGYAVTVEIRDSTTEEYVLRPSVYYGLTNSNLGPTITEGVGGKDAISQ